MLCYSVFKGRRSCSGVFCKKVFLKISQNSPENICVGVSFFINFIKKETSTQVFPFVSCEKFSNTFFIEHVWRVLLKSVCFKCFSTEVLPSKASIISCDSWLWWYLKSPICFFLLELPFRSVQHGGFIILSRMPWWSDVFKRNTCSGASCNLYTWYI